MSSGVGEGDLLRQVPMDCLVRVAVPGEVYGVRRVRLGSWR